MILFSLSSLIFYLLFDPAYALIMIFLGILLIEGIKQYRYFSTNPYSFFDIPKWLPAVFATYYCVTWLSNTLLVGENASEVTSGLLVSSGSIILSGYIGLQLGLGRPVKNRIATRISANSAAQKAMMATIMFSMALVFWSYAYRIELGIFYNHSRHVSGVTGNLQLLAISVQLPTVALLGTYKIVASESNRKWATFVFYSGTASIILTILMSSQIRLTISALFIAYLFSNNSDSDYITKSRLNLILLLSLFVLIVFTSFSFRIVNESDIRNAKNQFTHALSTTADNFAIVTEKGNASEVLDNASVRATGQIKFLQELIRREPYNPRIGGELIAKVLTDNIPKLLWPEKPPVIPIDTHIQRRHNMIPYDASAGPIVFLYTGFGAAGVFFGFIAIGYALRVYARQPSPLSALLVASFVLPAFLNLERELLTSIIAGVRSCVVVMTIYITIYLTLRMPTSNPSQRSRQSKSSVS
jgi:hypothetical protein